MSLLSDQMQNTKAWGGLCMGNHALARAMIETGTSVITSYPGSPVTEIGQALESVPVEKRNYYFEYSANEKVASEIAFGASINGHLSAVFFKSVGLNVAADAIVQFAMLHLEGGMVIVLGDDPGANSTQNEQDNRYYSRMMYIPMFEPASPAEAYIMYRKAASLSRELHVPVFLRLTTHVCHASEFIQFNSFDDSKKKFVSKFDPASHNYFPLVSDAMRMKKELLARLTDVKKSAKKLGLNELFPGKKNNAENVDKKNGRKLGIITASMPAFAVRELTVESSIDILKLGMTYPLDLDEIHSFLTSHGDVLILEEMDRILEGEIKKLAYDESLKCILKTKSDQFIQGELALSEVSQILNTAWPDLFSFEIEVPGDTSGLPIRSAQFCAGCGHRSAFYAIRKAIPNTNTRFTVAGIGCHLMGHYQPYDIGQVLVCMGHESSTATGLSLGNTEQKVITFMGDSTFFHAGLSPVANAALYNHNITLFIMDNGTTAMTGQQANAGSGEARTVDGKTARKIPIVDIITAMGVGFIKTVEAYNQEELTKIAKEAYEYAGFAVVIVRHPCMLKFMKAKKNRKQV